MKTLLSSFAVVLLAVGLSQAVVTHYTETLPPQTPTGNVPVSNGYDWTVSQNAGVVVSSATIGLNVQSLAAISASTAGVVGQMVFCQNCAAAGGAGTICISTTTVAPGAGSDFVLSTGTVCK
jgi:hypothetical protein